MKEAKQITKHPHNEHKMYFRKKKNGNKMARR
jgi:hypothetical protein